MKAIAKILDYVQGMRFESIPKSTIQHIKKHILDTLGATIAGSGVQSSQMLLQLIREWGGKEEGTIFVYGDKVPLHHAVWINSTMSRGFDYESILTGGATHVPASIIPAALGLAEYVENTRNRIVTGKELITSIAIGLDLNWRLRVAGTGKRKTGLGSGWLAETFSPIAIAALGSKMLNFKREEINNAMGIAFGQCCGHYGATVGKNGGFMAQISQGIGTKAGVLSVLLAEKGFTANKELIDGKWGLYALFGGGEYDEEILLGNLGSKFDHLVPYVKKYPGCGALQAPCEAILKIVRKHDLKPNEISKIKVKLDRLSYYLVAEGRKSTPSNAADALWNCFYVSGVAIKKRALTLEDFTEERIKSSQLDDIIAKMEIKPDRSKKARMGVDVEIETCDGNILKETIQNMGSLSDSEITEKFRACVRSSAKRFPEAKIGELIATIEHLEHLESSKKFINLLIA